MTIHPSVGPITTVRCLIRRAGMTAHYNCDLIFVGSIPTVVVEWSVFPDGDRPAATIPLDPQFLHHLGWESAEYMYEHTVDDPRRLD